MLKGADFSTVVIWFLYALAIIQFLFYAAIRAKDLKPLWQRVAVWAAIAAIVLLGLVAILHPDMNSYLQIKALVPGLLFFTMGYWMKRRGWAAPATWLAVPLFVAVAF